MSLAGLLVHTCTVKRPTHTKTDQEKNLGTSTVATGIPCRVEPAGDSPGAAILGIGAEMSRRVFFHGSADVIRRDILECSTGETMVAVSVERFHAGTPAIHHLEVRAAVREV